MKKHKEEVVESTTSAPEVTITESKKLGRPVDPNSARQKKLAEIAERKASNGYVQLGRPVVPGSKRQLELAKKAELKSQGIVAQRGRPKMTDEQKAAAKAAREAAKAAAQGSQGN